MTAYSGGSERLRVLVTGGAGFIGCHVAAALRKQGHLVTVADRLPGSDGEPAVVGDLCEAEIRDRAVRPDTDAIVHLAAETSVLGSIQRPAAVHRANVEMTAALLELARERAVKTFVLASTNAVVGLCEHTITEDLPLSPMTPYGSTKAAAEMLLSGYSHTYGLRTPSLRLTNVYGPGMSHKDSFVPRLLRAAAADDVVQIYGDGKQRRDLVHVNDVARAFVMALSNWPSGPVIVGSGESHTVLDMHEAACEATGCSIRARHVEPQKGEMPAVVVDIARARSRGYRPTVSLSDGLRTVWPDFCQRSGGPA